MARHGRTPRAAWLVALAAVAWTPRAPGQAAPDVKRKADAGPTVRSRAAADLLKPPGADLLKPPGADRYGPGEADWRDVPPWRQTSFFGIRAKGQLFVYVVDCSGSMIDEDRLFRAKSELRRSINRLRAPQRFKVIFYNDRPLPMPGDLPRPADLRSKGLLSEWLRLIEPDGETDPRAAMALALALRPDAVFLLSDGAFPDGTPEAIASANRKKVPIHCVDLSGGESGDGLRRIAAESGGQYAARPWTGSASP